MLNQSHVLIPALGHKTVSGGDHRWYFFRVKDVIEFLRRRWGDPDRVVSYPVANGGELAGQRGVILFEVDGWNDASGHATLWNGTSCYDHCYFNMPGVNYVTKRANFWALP